MNKRFIFQKNKQALRRARIAKKISTMAIKKYGVFDSTGELLRYFNTWKQAATFKISRGRMDWEISEIWLE